MANIDALVRDLAEAATASGRLGIDTEFVGEGRYRPLLCLAQVAVDFGSGIRIELLDPIEDEFDPTPLAKVLADPKIEIVMHAGRQDVTLLKRTWNTEIAGLFDTQIAAGFAGLRAQMGYDALLREVLRVKLEKSASFTRWEQRPLSEEQKRYAAEDVQHILQLAVALQNQLVDMGRLDWAIEECKPLELLVDDRDPETLFAKLPKIDRISSPQRAVAMELVRWREEAAEQADRPPSSVLQDQVLVELAKRRPTSKERLRQIRGLQEATLHRRGDSLLAAIARGSAAEPIDLEVEREKRSKPADPGLVVLVESLVRARAQEHEIAYEVLASRSDLGRIITSWRDGTSSDSVRTMQGWRRQIVGDDILRLLHGELSLFVGADQQINVSKS